MLFICVICIIYCREPDTNFSISTVAGLSFIVKLLVIERHVLQYASNFYIYSANDLCL